MSAGDVAREAGVSRTTVSFVLNNTPGKNIPESTRQRVLDAAAALGYIPNEDARRLARTRSLTVVLFICHSQFVYSDAFIMRVLEGMNQAVNRYRLRLVVQPVSVRESSYLEIARSLEATGAILINAHDEDPALIELAREHFPTVSMDGVGDVEVDQVYIDNEAAACEMTNHLITLGHKRIGMITHASPLFFASRNRLRGYRRALEAAEIAYDPLLVRYADFSEQSGYVNMQGLLRETSGLTAVFAGNDVVAYGAMQSVLGNQRAVPQEFSVAGFDDDYMSRFLRPALTTMVLPAASHGAAAVETLYARLTGEGDLAPIRRLLSSHIAIRESTGPAPVEDGLAKSNTD